jgi:hypothetical protein
LKRPLYVSGGDMILKKQSNMLEYKEDLVSRWKITPVHNKLIKFKDKYSIVHR